VGRWHSTEERDSSQKMDGSGIATHTSLIFQGLDPLGVRQSASNKMQDKSDTYTF